MESNKTDSVITSNSYCSCLHTSSVPCSCELERRTERNSNMDGVERRREAVAVRWCHRCKHEVPDWILTDRCDWCGGDVVEIN